VLNIYSRQSGTRKADVSKFHQTRQVIRSCCQWKVWWQQWVHSYNAAGRRMVESWPGTRIPADKLCYSFRWDSTPFMYVIIRGRRG